MNAQEELDHIQAFLTSGHGERLFAGDSVYEQVREMASRHDDEFIEWDDEMKKLRAQRDTLLLAWDTLGVAGRHLFLA